MARIDRPSKASIARIAENQPELLNVLLAYFVFEWREVRVANPAHGLDQMGTACLVPDYVATWGTDAAVHYLLRSPARREPDGPGFISEWLHEVAMEDA